MCIRDRSRDELVREARRTMLELIQGMRDAVCDHPDAERLVLELAAQLETVKGKKSYGYLPKRLKKLVDEIVDEMERLPAVSKCYDQWMIPVSYTHLSRMRSPLTCRKVGRGNVCQTSLYFPGEKLLQLLVRNIGTEMFFG